MARILVVGVGGFAVCARPAPEFIRQRINATRPETKAFFILSSFAVYVLQSTK
jgi:hypothetical protein